MRDIQSKQVNLIENINALCVTGASPPPPNGSPPVASGSTPPHAAQPPPQDPRDIPSTSTGTVSSAQASVPEDRVSV